MSINLRRYLPSDHKEVLRLQREGLEQIGASFEHPIPEQTLLDHDLDEIESVYLKAGEFLVATASGQTIGVGAIRPYSKEERCAEIKRMRVDRNWQSQGVGSQILSALIKKGSELGYRRFVLDTTVDNVQARRFYENRGFKLFRHSTIYGIFLVHYEKNLNERDLAQFRRRSNEDNNC